MSAIRIEDVAAFCEQQRADGKGYAACNHCPIHQACTSGCSPLTQASLDAWRDRCISAFERHLGASS